MKIYIKNMVCSRCILMVREVLNKLGIEPVNVSFGEILLREDTLDRHILEQLDRALESLGFGRIDDHKAYVIEKIKNLVIQTIHRSESLHLSMNWSDILVQELNIEYNYLSNLFSSLEGITLEQYIIRQKIERVKELLFYDELNLNEIADKLGYKSVQHLSSQFKRVTGFTPSGLKKSRHLDENRKPLDGISS